MAEDLARLVGDLGYRTCIPIGHSMGGKAAMTLALSHPDLVEKVGVVDIAPNGYNGDVRESFQVAFIMQSMPLDGSISTVQEADQWLAPKIPNVNVRRFLLQSLVVQRGLQPRWRFNLQSFVSNMDALALYEPRGFPAYTRPALFLRGDLSDYIDEAQHGALIHELFPNARITTIDNSNHWVHFDNPDQFIQRIVEFVKQ